MSGTVLKVLTGRNSIKPNGKQGMFYKQPKIIKEIDFANALTIILATLLMNTYKKILSKETILSYTAAWEKQGFDFVKKDVEQLWTMINQ